jgi:hypothetical protein
MWDGGAQPSWPFDYPCGIPERCGQVIDVVQAHLTPRPDQAPHRRMARRGVPQHGWFGVLMADRKRHQRRGGVDTHHPVPQFSQPPRQAPFTTGQVKRQAARGREQAEQGRKNDLLVGLIHAGCPR